MGEHRAIIKRAKYAGSTPDINTGVETTSMMNTTAAMVNRKRGRGERGKSHFWVPTVGAEVRVLWADSGARRRTVEGVEEGTWWAGKVTELAWPEEQGMPGAYIQYHEGGVVEWHAMALFGESIELVKVPKDIVPKGLKQLTKKKGKEFTINYTERFPKVATEWLGYGAEVQVRCERGWHVGKVIGEEGPKVLVQYAGGIGAHDHLHTVGCRIRTFRRKVDMDAMYQNSPWKGCPFKGKDEACICWPCRTEKWPRRYREGNLSTQQIKELELLKPEGRDRVIKKYLSEKIVTSGGHLLAKEQNGGISSNARSGAPASQDNEDAEGGDEAPESTREEGDQQQRSEGNDREAEGRHSVGLRRNPDRKSRACERGHAPEAKRHRASEGERRSSSTPEADGPGAQGRDEGQRARVAGRERGDHREGDIPAEAREAHATEGGEEEHGVNSRRAHSNPGSDSRVSRRRDGDANGNTEQVSREREVARVGGGCGGVAGEDGVEVRGGGERDPKEGREPGGDDGTEERNTANPEPGGGVGVNQKGGGEKMAVGACDGCGPKGIHLGGKGEGTHHSRSGARLERPATREGPDRHAVKEGVCVGEKVGPDIPRARVHTVQRRQCNEPSVRVCPWAVGRDRSQPSCDDSREADKGEGVVPRGEGGSDRATRVAGKAPGHPVLRRESSRVRAVGPAKGEGNHRSESGLGGEEDRQVCLRKRRAETDRDSDEQKGLDTEREDRKRQVQSGELYWSQDSRRQDKTPEADHTELQGEAAKHGRQSARSKGARREGRQECPRTGAGGGDVWDGTDELRRRPRGGSQAGDDNERNRRRQEKERRRAGTRRTKKRTREGGGKGGTKTTALEDDL